MVSTDQAPQGCKHGRDKPNVGKIGQSLKHADLDLEKPIPELVSDDSRTENWPLCFCIPSPVPGTWAGAQVLSGLEWASPDVRVSTSASLEEENAISLSSLLRLNTR